jgi:16S rRNA (cytidine1402-2'-O)-methyltransferase
LFVVATPIGNLDDITARAIRILGQVTLIAAEDTRRTRHLLARYAITTPTTSLHEHNEAQKSPGLVDRLKRGEHIALVSDAGTPTISDPGQRFVRAAADAGVRIESIPGPSAIVAALAASGFAGNSFSFLGFPPTRSKERKAWFAELTEKGGIVVFFESPHRVKATLGHLLELVGDCQVAVGRELTKVHEEFLRGHISEVLARLTSPRGEFTIVADLAGVITAGLECGHITECVKSSPAIIANIAAEFGHMTADEGLTRRRAIRELARTRGVSTNAVYAAIEQAKKSGE